jgi:hypothetical protein
LAVQINKYKLFYSKGYTTVTALVSMDYNVLGCQNYPYNIRD